jgi:hypothetical protein
MYVMPDLIRHPVFLTDSCFRRNDTIAFCKGLEVFLGKTFIFEELNDAFSD